VCILTGLALLFSLLLSVAAAKAADILLSSKLNEAEQTAVLNHAVWKSMNSFTFFFFAGAEGGHQELDLIFHPKRSDSCPSGGAGAGRGVLVFFHGDK
jgi:hypothetical protein